MLKNLFPVYSLLFISACGSESTSIVNASSIDNPAGFINHETSNDNAMIGYVGKTEKGETCQVFIAGVRDCFFGYIDKYALYLSVTQNKAYQLSNSPEGHLMSYGKEKAYALINSIEDQNHAINGLTEAGLNLPQTGEKWVCKDLKKTESRYNHFNDHWRCK